MKIKSVADFSPSLIWRLRYIEWLFITVHLIMAITAGSDKLLFNLAVYGVFIVLSWIIPVDRPLKFRQGYVLLAMIAIVWANFLNVSLDLLLYLYLAKSFFLLGGKSIIYITVLTGVGWVGSECFSEIREFQQLSVGFKPPFGFGNYNLSTIFVFSLGLYIAISIFTIFLSSVIVAEYKSRKRAEALAEQVEILAKNLERTRIARDIHDSLGHTLTNLDIQLKVAQKLRDRDPEKAFQAIDTAAMLSSQCIEDVSHAVQTMRRDNFDLDRALNNLIEQVRSDRTIKIQWNVIYSHLFRCAVRVGFSLDA